MSIFANTAKYGNDVTLGQVFASQQTAMPFTEDMEVTKFEDEFEDEAPSVAINLPMNADVSFNFVPKLNDTKGEFTDLDELEGPVENPYSEEPALPEEVQDFIEETEADTEDSEVNPEEGDIESVTDSDEARYLSLQDLM